MDGRKYATYPGCTKQDNNRCLKCRWHSILVDYVVCDYSLYETHGLRGCPYGVACTKFEPGKRPAKESAKQRKRTKTVRLDRNVYKILVWAYGRKAIYEATGYSKSGIDGCLQRERIRRVAAKSILDKFGLDISGGELVRGDE